MPSPTQKPNLKLRLRGSWRQKLKERNPKQYEVLKKHDAARARLHRLEKRIKFEFPENEELKKRKKAKHAARMKDYRARKTLEKLEKEGKEEERRKAGKKTKILKTRADTEKERQFKAKDAARQRLRRANMADKQKKEVNSKRREKRRLEKEALQSLAHQQQEMEYIKETETEKLQQESQRLIEEWSTNNIQSSAGAEKTEVLSDDLQQCEKKVDNIKDACQKTVKKLSACLQGTGQDVEKRTRKLPHTVLGQSMQDSSQALGDNSILGLTLAKTGEIWTNIGIEVTSHEMALENVVLAPFNLLLENEIPSIMTLKRKLNKLTLDLDSAKGRYQTASSKGIDKEHISKIEAIRDEMEQCQWKVDACKESLATEMMSFVAKDGMIARCLVDMVESQAQYHRNVLARLEKLIPQLRDNLTETPNQVVFGLALEDHLRLQGRDIASPLETCIFWIMELGLDEEGLFRIAGSASKIKLIRAALDANVEIDMEYGIEHALAGVLKQYLRELPEPLLTFRLYPEFMQTLSIKDKDQKLQALWTVVNKLPQANYNNFKYLIKFLSRVANRSDQNKMNASNLSLVVGPNCIWSEEDGGLSVTSTGVSATIIENFISYADWFFKEDINFTITRPKSNSFSETTPSSVETAETPAPSSDNHSQASPAVTAVQSSPVHQSPVSAASPLQFDNSSPLLQPHLLTEKLKSSSLPRRSVKKNPAPPVPNMSPTQSLSSSLSRDTQVPTASSSSTDNDINGNAPANEHVTPERPDRPAKLDKPVKPERPPVLEKPARPLVPTKKNSQGREVRMPNSPPPLSSYGNVPPSPTLRPKSAGLPRPTISPPPPPPPPPLKSPKRSGSEEIPEETTHF